MQLQIKLYVNSKEHHTLDSAAFCFVNRNCPSQTKLISLRVRSPSLLTSELKFEELGLLKDT
jgi:hypothetical protein